MLRQLVLACLAATLIAAEGPSPTPNAEPAPITLGIEDAARLAAERSREVLAAYANAVAARSEARAGTAELWPQIVASAGYARRRDLDFRDEDVYDAGVRGDLLLFGIGLRSATSRAAEATRLLGENELTSARLGAARLGRELAINVLFAKATVTVASERLDQRRSELADARSLFEAGTVARIDVRAAEIDEALASNALRQVSAGERSARLSLIQTLALDEIGLDASVAVDGSLDAEPRVADLLELAQTRLDQGADLQSVDLRRRQVLAAADRQQAAGLPTLGVYAQAGYGGSDLDDLEEDWQVGIALRWAWNGGANQANAEAARQTARALAENRFAVVESRQTRYAAAVIEAQNLSEQIAEQRRVVELVQANYEDVRELYRAGRVTLTRVGDASLAVAETRFALIDLLRRQWLLAVELKDLAEQLP